MWLEAKDISFSYRDAATLREVTLSVEPGVFLGILGVNGSGKSTLMNCLDDLLRPQSGTVTADGDPLAGLRPTERAQRIAYVTQHSHANRSTVFETLLLGRKPHIRTVPGEADYAAVERVIAEFHLEHLAQRYVDELSGGEYQKMVIARAFVQDTPVLLLDEPTNNLDLANQIEVLESVRRAARDRGVAVAAVMHDINLALWFCDELAILKDGALMAIVPAANITAELISEAYGVQAEIIEHRGRRLAMISGPEDSAKDGADAVTSQEPLSMEETPFGDVAAYFDARADGWDASCSLGAAVSRKLDAIMPELFDARIIDVACGTGVMVNYYLRHRAAHVQAVDISPKMAVHAAEKFAGDDRVEVRCADILQADLAPADVVVIYNAYPHFPDKEALERKIASLVKPGGHCLIIHGMGRDALNGHHQAQAAGVSTPLGSALDEAGVWLQDFALTGLVDDESFYAIRLRKLENRVLQSEAAPL